MAHWHDFNPWSAKLCYTSTLDEWLDCLALQSSRKWYEEEARRLGQKIDCYLLPGVGGLGIQMGLRFGPNGEDYLSPPCDQETAFRVLQKYGAIK